MRYAGHPVGPIKRISGVEIFWAQAKVFQTQPPKISFDPLDRGILVPPSFLSILFPFVLFFIKGTTFFFPRQLLPYPCSGSSVKTAFPPPKCGPLEQFCVRCLNSFAAPGKPLLTPTGRILHSTAGDPLVTGPSVSSLPLLIPFPLNPM